MQNLQTANSKSKLREDFVATIIKANILTLISIPAKNRKRISHPVKLF